MIGIAENFSTLILTMIKNETKYGVPMISLQNIKNPQMRLLDNAIKGMTSILQFSVQLLDSLYMSYDKSKDINNMLYLFKNSACNILSMGGLVVGPLFKSLDEAIIAIIDQTIVSMSASISIYKSLAHRQVKTKYDVDKLKELVLKRTDNLKKALDEVKTRNKKEKNENLEKEIIYFDSILFSITNLII